MIVLQKTEKRDRLITIRGGYVRCPFCRRNRKVKRIGEHEFGHDIVCFCRTCKTEFEVDVDEDGQCYLSRSL